MRHERPENGGEVRSSALWGRGGREARASALWGRGGRSAVALLALLVSVVIPAAGIAGERDYRALVPGDLISAAQADEEATFSVIVQGDPRGKSSDLASEIRSELSSGRGDGSSKFKRLFSSITGASVEISGKELLKLARHPHVTSITRDDRVELSDYVSWRDAIGVASLWDLPAISCKVNKLGVQLDPLCTPRPAQPAPQAPAIAIVDSGIDASRVENFGSRIVARANLSSLEPDVAGDPSGHGTMVAGIAAGSLSQLPGVAMNAPLVDVRVASSNGEALTSDIVAAVDWILENKGTYNIRVANFSLAGSSEASFRFHPLNRAVEKLWLNGVVVVAAVGNHGSASGPVKIPAPANDPFVISVGALDIRNTADPSDDFRAPWSAYGPTADGFMKPDLSAPGRYMLAPVSVSSSLAAQFPGRIVAQGYMWMSGTSYAAPLVAGVAAQVLARNPGFTPDQVKGALMASAQYLPNQDPGAGVGELNAARAVTISSPPNPNENLYQFVSDSTFNADAWAEHVSANANWTASNWSAANWTASNWTQSNWTQSNWVASNWTQSNWVSSNWTASNWTASNWTVSNDQE